jgi:outer membrane protein TolC
MFGIRSLSKMKCVKSIAAIALALLACAAARAQQQEVAPTAPLPDAPAPQNSLTLKEVVALAVRNSRDLQLAKLQLTVAQRQAGSGAAAFLPNIYVGSGAAFTHGLPLLAGGGVPAIFTASYQQSLYDPELRAQVHIAQQRADQQQIALDGVRDAVMLKAATEYLELAKVRHELDLMRDEQSSAQKILELMQDRVTAGQELPIENVRAQLGVARADQQIAQLEDQDATLSADLADLTGLPDGQSLAVNPEELPPAAGASVDDLVNQATLNNPDLKIAESVQQSSEFELKGARGAYWPTISLIGQYNLLSRANHFDEFFNKFETNNFLFGVEVQIPIFAGRNSAALHLAQADVASSTFAVQQKRADLSRDVQRQARQEHEMELASRVAKLELQLAEDNLHNLEAQYDQGRAPLKDLEAAHLDETQKWLAFLDADFARQQSQLQLLQTTGQISTALQ